MTIGIGPTDSVLWIAVYIPFKGGKEEGNGLEAIGSAKRPLCLVPLAYAVPMYLSRIPSVLCVFPPKINKIDTDKIYK
jgi:hypothetical protein